MDEDEEWRIAYPIGQLVEHPRVNNCAFGVLTSATRTYFVRVMNPHENELKLQISRRWYVAEPKYIQAWYWFKETAENVALNDKAVLQIRHGLREIQKMKKFHRERK